MANFVDVGNTPTTPNSSRRQHIVDVSTPRTPPFTICAQNSVSKIPIGVATRLAAAQVVAEVLGNGTVLDMALDQYINVMLATSPGCSTCSDKNTRDKALVQEMAYGVLRLLPRLRSHIAGLTTHNAKIKDLQVECLIMVGLYQLENMRVPEHAAVSQTVAAAKLIHKNWATGFINAVLRKFLRHQKKITHDQTEVGITERGGSGGVHHISDCFPEWLATKLQRCWPDAAAGIMHASNLHPPMTLRINTRKIGVKAYLTRLADLGLAAHQLPHSTEAIVLEQPLDVHVLPGFAAGQVSVQDAAAQLAVPLLEIPKEVEMWGAPPRPPEVLDACAAPGGKTGHILELHPTARVTAVDIDPQRVMSLHQSLTRLGLASTACVKDVGDTHTPSFIAPRVLIADLTMDPLLHKVGSCLPQAQAAAWADRLYDRILLDAPCSATGVIRRHPDIKWRRRPSDIPTLAACQGRMLDNLWKVLHPGGVLLYVTCSILPEENQDTVAAFLQRTPDAFAIDIVEMWGHPTPPTVPWGHACASAYGSLYTGGCEVSPHLNLGRQILTGEDDMDGFYFAKIGKKGQCLIGGRGGVPHISQIFTSDCNLYAEGEGHHTRTYGEFRVIPPYPQDSLPSPAPELVEGSVGYRPVPELVEGYEDAAVAHMEMGGVGEYTHHI